MTLRYKEGHSGYDGRDPGAAELARLDLVRVELEHVEITVAMSREGIDSSAEHT